MSRKCGRILLRTRMIDEKIRCGVGSPHAAPGFFCGNRRQSVRNGCAASTAGADLQGDWGFFPNKQMSMGSTHALLATRVTVLTSTMIGTILRLGYCIISRERKR